MARRTKKELAVSPELEQELAQYADEEAKLERPAVSSISTRSGVMTYMDTPIEGNNLDVIVVGYSFERVYYTAAYDPDEITPPACYALSLDGRDMEPPQDFGFGTDCETCQWNKWRTATRNDGKPGKGKACSERRRLLVVPAGEEDGVITKGTLADSELAVIHVPVTSVKNWSTYINKLRTGISRPVWAVVTNIKLVPDTRTQFQMKFDLVSKVESSDLIQELRQANVDSEVHTLRGFDMASDSEEPVKESNKM